jgi:tetratricopeptide (TPR) repeat protein
MTKTGRNDPCHCGSGKKYKRCCLDNDEAAERATRTAAQAAKPALTPPAFFGGPLLDELDELDELTNASNGVIDLIRAGKIDEAEQAARDLLTRYPEVHDGYDRLGMVYEARGDHKQAAHCYRQVIDFVRAHPDQYEPEFEATFHRLIQKLDPPTAVD